MSNRIVWLLIPMLSSLQLFSFFINLTSFCVSVQLFPQCVSPGGRAAAGEGGREGKPAAETREQRELLRRHHQTGPWWVHTHTHTYTHSCIDILNRRTNQGEITLNLTHLCTHVVLAVRLICSSHLCFNWLPLSLSLSLSLSSSSVIKHYLVTPNHGGGFIIDVDNPVSSRKTRLCALHLLMLGNNMHGNETGTRRAACVRNRLRLIAETSAGRWKWIPSKLGHVTSWKRRDGNYNDVSY